MRKHRRISRAPSSLRRSWTFGRTGRLRGPIRSAEVQACSAEFLEHGVRDACSTFSSIDRPADPSPRAVRGAQAQVPSPAWSPGRRGQTPSAAAPIFLRPDVTSISRSGRSGQLALGGLYIRDSHAGATQLSPRCYVGNGIGVATGAFGETLLTPRSVHGHSRNKARPVVLFSCQSPRAAGAPLSSGLPALLPCCAALAVPSPHSRPASRASSVGSQAGPQQTPPSNIAIPCDGTLDFGPPISERPAESQCFQALWIETWRATAHHPPTTPPATSRSALERSNHSNMATSSASAALREEMV